MASFDFRPPSASKESVKALLRSVVFFTVLLFAGDALWADDPAPRPSQAQMEEIASSLKWQTGTITLKDGLATIKLTDNFRYLDPADSEKVLHDLWGNPPGSKNLGMIFPANVGPLSRDGWGIEISYEADGYVKDNDADKINYTDLLKQMQQDVKDGNEQRVKDGYPAMQLIGWAAPPRYDKETHKLYWAKELKLEGDSDSGLNYNIRILGRRGVLVLNAIAGMDQLGTIDKEVPEILSMVDFQPGNTYADFDPKIDKIAEYGLATLVAGGALGAAAKLGLLGLLWKYIIVVVFALKKALIVVIVAIVGLFKKISSWFSRDKSSTPEHLLPPRNQPQTPVDYHPPVPPVGQPPQQPPYIPPRQE
jgi:uncharacterized membrane-anchored protein